ncbi:MAG TPA: hypothetical protein P5330_11540 [Candidatus Competibacteraceae bacterium]|nr:hypothetical protein [Candidatus Competibacteraceae bacterium]
MAKGGKLSRTEVVPVRFDPVTKWALEISATQDRRPLGSMIEYLVALAMRDHPVTTREGGTVSAMQAAQECWSKNQSLRLFNLSSRYSELMSYEERQICESARVALQFDAPRKVSPVFEQVLIDKIWPFILQHAEGKIEAPHLWLECRKAAAWLIEDSGGNAANLLRGLARGELSPAEFAGRLDADTSAKEQLLNILGES